VTWRTSPQVKQLGLPTSLSELPADLDSPVCGSGTPLNRIYTELYITEVQKERVKDVALKIGGKPKITLHDTPIRCQDIFKPLPGQDTHIRVVLTQGVAGIGKTFSVQKFTLDWAEGLENQHVSLVVLLSFRELNLIKDERYSLLQLLRVFHPTLQTVTAEKLAVCKVVFIFDGLDESRFLLHFQNNEVVSDVTRTTSVNVLLTNLIKGNLLPSALLWITSRPAAANQIPPTCVDRVTEVRGFTDLQKEEYFRRRFSDEKLCSRIISHIKASRSLHIMCHIPVLCWITATVLEHMLTTDQRGELPKSLTDMYSHFLLVQTQRKKHKYDERCDRSQQELMETDREVLLKLGRLAYEHLKRGNLMFYQEDLEECGLDVTEASVYSGVCTEIFKTECVLLQRRVYCFVHLSIQEFLAAVYIFYCYISGDMKVLNTFLGRASNGQSLDVVLKAAMLSALQRKNGHLDLFVRFLHGLSLESNQRLLGGLLGQTESRPEDIQRAINNLKEMNTYKLSPNRSINIFHCLMEMNDLSVHQDIQEFLMSENRSGKELSAIHCSALAYMLQMSEGVLDEFELHKCNTPLEGRQRLIPSCMLSSLFRLIRCRLSESSCASLASALKSNPHLADLDLSYNNLKDSGMKLLCAGLESPNCRLKTLRSAFFICVPEVLNRFVESSQSCEALLSAYCSSVIQVTLLSLLNSLERLKLRSCPSRRYLMSTPGLVVLDLSYNYVDPGLKLLSDGLESPSCRLKTLRLKNTFITNEGCASLASALKSNPHLTELELNQNQQLQVSGVKLLSAGLESPNCRLETLRLKNCKITDEACAFLASALKSNPHLTELDLSENYELRDSGAGLLSAGLRSPNCRLKTLRLKNCSLSEFSCAPLASALKFNPSHLTELDLRGNDRMHISAAKMLCPLVRVKITEWMFRGQSMLKNFIVCSQSSIKPKKNNIKWTYRQLLFSSQQIEVKLDFSRHPARSKC
uniref:NACHT domain-containing protein n=1 Tax=Myripristis murdjan TaxID=586833 RepID=A0A667XAN1_9TELE